jgi:hypothetical protein
LLIPPPKDRREKAKGGIWWLNLLSFCTAELFASFGWTKIKQEDCAREMRRCGKNQSDDAGADDMISLRNYSWESVFIRATRFYIFC